jgi:hypothetical protein
MSACNSVYSLDGTRLREYHDAMQRPDADPRVDRDQDGIKDVEDPCIAPWTDGVSDSDGDMITNTTDGCPFNPGPHSDKDGDGIGDPCDPEDQPNTLQCVMAFTDPDLTSLLWTATVDGGWSYFRPRELYGRIGAVLAQWPFEAATGTTAYDVIGQVFPATQRVGLIPRIASATDAEPGGCNLTFDGSTWRLETGSSKIPIISARDQTTYNVRLSVVLDAAQTSYECIGSVQGVRARARTDDGVPYGNVAFVVDADFVGGGVVITGFAVYSR